MVCASLINNFCSLEAFPNKKLILTCNSASSLSICGKTYYHISPQSESSLPSRNKRKHKKPMRKVINSHSDTKIIILILPIKPSGNIE